MPQIDYEYHTLLVKLFTKIAAIALADVAQMQNILSRKTQYRAILMPIFRQKKNLDLVWQKDLDKILARPEKFLGITLFEQRFIYVNFLLDIHDFKHAMEQIPLLENPLEENKAGLFLVKKLYQYEEMEKILSLFSIVETQIDKIKSFDFLDALIVLSEYMRILYLLGQKEKAEVQYLKTTKVACEMENSNMQEIVFLKMIVIFSDMGLWDKALAISEKIPDQLTQLQQNISLINESCLVLDKQYCLDLAKKYFQQLTKKEQLIKPYSFQAIGEFFMMIGQFFRCGWTETELVEIMLRSGFLPEDQVIEKLYQLTHDTSYYAEKIAIARMRYAKNKQKNYYLDQAWKHASNSVGIAGFNDSPLINYLIEQLENLREDTLNKKTKQICQLVYQLNPTVRNQELINLAIYLHKRDCHNLAAELLATASELLKDVENLLEKTNMQVELLNALDQILV